MELAGDFYQLVEVSPLWLLILYEKSKEFMQLMYILADTLPSPINICPGQIVA